MKGRIAILTGGGDVPGLNPAIRAITEGSLALSHEVIGIRRGWHGLVNYVPDDSADNSSFITVLNQIIVGKASRTGGTILHTSRTNPSNLSQENVPAHLASKYQVEKNDITPEILKNLEHLGIEHLIVIGGDDTLSYGKRLSDEGVKVIGIPKTMDNDVPGTDYCIGFSTCVSRTIEYVNQLRTTAGSHERILVVEVFGRYAGFTALAPAAAGVCDRCLIPESSFDVERLTELLVFDRNNNPSRYAVVLVSEGAKLSNSMEFENGDLDEYGHKKLGGIGDKIAYILRKNSPRYNKGHEINTISQRLGYLVRSGVPDALDSTIPAIFGIKAIRLIEKGIQGVLINFCRGIVSYTSIEIVTGQRKQVDVSKYYDPGQYKPITGVSLLPLATIEG